LLVFFTSSSFCWIVDASQLANGDWKIVSLLLSVTRSSLVGPHRLADRSCIKVRTGVVDSLNSCWWT
jgi:hypothetical protein